MSDPTELAKTIFEGCAANVGPLIGMELENGEVSIDQISEPPSGDLAVLPVACEVDSELLANVCITSPLTEIAKLARRMLGAEDPDKEGDLTDDDIDALGEVLNLMSGAVDQAIRENLNDSIRSRPLAWWRTPDPGENKFEEGELWEAKGSLGIPDGPAVPVSFVFPQTLLERGAEAATTKSAGEILLLGLDEELKGALTPILEGARMTVEAKTPDDELIEEAYEKADAFVLCGVEDSTFELIAKLRKSNSTWTKPSIQCMQEPTKSLVIRAMESGASRVLRIPADDTTVLRILNLARGT